VLPSFRIRELKRNVDKRGSFVEISREERRDFFGDDKIIRTNLSYSYPGVICARHRHSRGQVDYIVAPKGAMKLCAYDDTPHRLQEGALRDPRVSKSYYRNKPAHK
jgi:dTDP-4-dehydrorhamnose 3,5-epimerase